MLLVTAIVILQFEIVYLFVEVTINLKKNDFKRTINLKKQKKKVRLNATTR